MGKIDFKKTMIRTEYQVKDFGLYCADFQAKTVIKMMFNKYREDLGKEQRLL